MILLRIIQAQPWPSTKICADFSGALHLPRKWGISATNSFTAYDPSHTVDASFSSSIPIQSKLFACSTQLWISMTHSSDSATQSELPTMSHPKPSPWSIFLVYLRLGCLSFGGPVAHLGYFKEAFVSRLKWLSEARYAELMALCQSVPGPSSSQLGFAIGWHRGGLPGAIAAWIGFTLPSACLMIGVAYGLVAWGDDAGPFIHGLLVAAVGVVANAVVGLAKKLCPDATRALIALASAGIVLLFPSHLTQLGMILIGVGLGNLLYRKQTRHHAAPEENPIGVSHRIVLPTLLFFAALMLVSLSVTADTPGAIYAMHYQAGALVFGGGHVVLPLLHDTVVAGGLVSESDFLAGYSAAQALPGPLFALSAFLGTMGSHHWLGGIGALIAIFLPGMLLIAALLPTWDRFRDKIWAQAGMVGANAVVVGLLLAAFVTPVWAHGIQDVPDFVLAAAAFVALYRLKLPAWAVVLGCGACGWFL